MMQAGGVSGRIIAYALAGLAAVVLGSCRTGGNGVAGPSRAHPTLGNAQVQVQVGDLASGNMHTTSPAIVDAQTGLILTTESGLELADAIAVLLPDGDRRKAWLRLVDPVSLISVLECEGDVSMAGLTTVDAFPDVGGMTFLLLPTARDSHQSNEPTASVDVRTQPFDEVLDRPWYRTLSVQGDDAAEVRAGAPIIDERGQLAGVAVDVFEGEDGFEVGCVPGPAVAKIVQHAATRPRWTHDRLDDGDVRWIELWGFDADSDLNDVNMWGFDAVRVAVYAGSPAVLEALIAAGADVDRPGRDGGTALMLAVQGEQWAAVDALLAGGADPNRADDDGMSAIAAAVMFAGEAILRQLIDHGGEVNAVAGGTPLLILAADRGSPGIAQILLQHGADVDTRAEGDRATPLMIAASVDNENLVELLIDRGADMRARDAFGATALHYAAMYGSHWIGAMLLEAGASATVRCDEGLLPIDYARERPDADLWVEVLNRPAPPGLRLPF